MSIHIWPFLDFSNLWGDNCQRWNVITYSVQGAWSISRLIKTQRSHSLVSWVSYNKQTSVKFLITSGYQLHYHRSKAIHCLFLKIYFYFLIDLMIIFGKNRSEVGYIYPIYIVIYESVQCYVSDKTCLQCNISKS